MYRSDDHFNEPGQIQAKPYFNITFENKDKATTPLWCLTHT